MNIQLFVPFTAVGNKALPHVRKPDDAAAIARIIPRLVEHLGSDRRDAELYIGQRYARNFGARIQAFMPRLFTVRDGNNRICSAFGLRAAHHRLFSERYLDAPIEQRIGCGTGHRICRREIVEVGHLCGAYAGAMRCLIALLVPALAVEGFGWIVFTGTAALRNAFSRAGLHPLDLGPARIESLAPEERLHWDRYYALLPRVSAAEIDPGTFGLAQQSFCRCSRKTDLPIRRYL